MDSVLQCLIFYFQDCRFIEGFTASSTVLNIIHFLGQIMSNYLFLYAGYSRGCKVAKYKEGWPTTPVLSVKSSDTKYVVKSESIFWKGCSEEVK